MGECDVNKEGNEVVGTYKSFEGVLRQGNLGNINFNHRVNLKIRVSFQNNVFPILHMCKFLSDSNLHGWLVSFVGVTFTNATIICKSEDMWNDIFYCMDKTEELTEVMYDKVE